MEPRIPGIHHVTSIAGDPQRNLEFYSGLLGLRLVKKTVNFDDPGTYHLYYGDALGRPGTILTFFPWSDLPRGREGAGQAVEVSCAVPADALGWWRERLELHGVAVERRGERFEEEALAFRDGDGLALELVAGVDAIATSAGGAAAAASAGAADTASSATTGAAAWSGRRFPGFPPVPGEFAIRGLHTVTLREGDPERTAGFLAASLGLARGREEKERLRLESDGEGAGRRVDLIAAPGVPRGRMGVGAVHHVAFRVAGDAEQRVLQGRLAASGADVTPVQDRCYFHSIYFHEPGGVLLEVATDPPGFTVDEPVESLGGTLKLPPWLEPMRARIEAALPPL